MFRRVARWNCERRTSLLVGLARIIGLRAAFVSGCLLAQGLAAGNGAGPPLDVWPVARGGWQPTAVTAVLQSHDGYLWVSTYHGLARFDGVRFSVYDAGNTAGLANGLITALYEDPQGALWIGHETGDLTRYAEGEFKPVVMGVPWPGGAVESISTDESGDLWLLSSGGVLLRVRDSHLVQCPGGATPSRKAMLARGNDGRLWVVSNGQVSRLEQGRIEAFNFVPGEENGFCERVAPSLDGGLWVLGRERLRKWRDGQWLEEISGGPRGEGAVTCLNEVPSGALVAGTLKDGVYVLRPGGAVLHFSRTNRLSHDWVRSVCEDREGNLWVATAASLDSLRPREVQMLTAPDGFQGCAVFSFVTRAGGSAWVGTEGAGLYHFQGDEWKPIGPENGLSNQFVWSVLETRRGDLYVSTYGGGVLMRKGDRFEVPAGLAELSAPALALYEDRKRTLWLGTTAGLYRYDRGKLALVAGKDKLSRPDVRAITETPDGALWFGMSGGGVGRLKEGALTQYRRKDGLSSDFVVALYAEADGTLWIGTSENGLTRFKAGKFSVISTAQGLPDSIVCHLVDDGKGNLWISSHAGIGRASKADLNRCADGAIKSVRFLSYGEAEGLSSQICSGGFQPGACRAADGRLWFPTARGLAIVDPARAITNSVPPPVAIEGLLVDGKTAAPVSVARGRSVRLDTSYRIPPGSQRFEVLYTALSFTAPDKVRFRHRLDGLEPDWVEAGNQRVAQYSYLPPGNYTFLVKACNNDDVWNETGASLAFTVLPYFWQAWWFHVGSFAAAAGLVAAVIAWISRRRVRRKLEQLERQRALERERARIARDIHDDLGASLTRISMLSQTVRGELDGQASAAADVDAIYTTARELTRAMDEIVWAVNPKHDTLDSLVTYLGRFAQNFLSTAGIRCRLDVPMQLPGWALTSEVRHNVFLAFKEALNNVVKHAQATEVRITLELQPEGFMLVLADNGRGFNWSPAMSSPTADVARVSAGNGLANMLRRMEEIGGCCGWDTAPGEGTRAKIVVVTPKEISDFGFRIAE